MSIENLLSRLEKVRKRGGNQWMASCPCHEDKTPSLSIKESSGTILIHCFAQQCTPEEICSAIGMEVTDLFPPSDDYDAAKSQQRKQFYDAAQILEGLAWEMLVAHVITADVLKNGTIDAEERARLAQASMRINAAMVYTNRIINS